MKRLIAAFVAIAVAAVAQAPAPGLFIGSVNAAFPNAGLKGSLVGVGINAAASTASFFPGTNNAIGCGSTGGLWLWGGVFRNVTLLTTNTNGVGVVSSGVSTNCLAAAPTGPTAFTVANFGGGPIIPPSAVAGAFTSPAAFPSWWHQDAFNPFAFGTSKGLSSSFTGSTILDIAAEFVDDAGLSRTIIPNGSTSALTASSTQYLGFYGSAVNSTELNVAVPIPIAGTIDGTLLCDSSAPTATVTVTLRKSAGAAGSNSFTMPVTVGCNYDTTDNVPVVAGDYIDFQTVSGATTQLTPLSSQISFYASDGTSTIIGGYLNAATVSTTKTFNAPLTSKTSTTEASAQTVLPVAENCTNLYVVKATANSSVTTTYTIRDNGVDTAITGTESAGTGAIAIYTGTAVSIAAGHKIDLSYVTASGTSGTMAGWAMSCK